jgi:hypothetical protein
MINWNPIFDGTVDGRLVQILSMAPSSLRVVTSQKETVSTESNFEPGSNLFGVVINAGDKIEIDAESLSERNNPRSSE